MLFHSVLTMVYLDIGRSDIVLALIFPDFCVLVWSIKQQQSIIQMTQTYFNDAYPIKDKYSCRLHNLWGRKAGYGGVEGLVVLSKEWW